MKKSVVIIIAAILLIALIIGSVVYLVRQTREDALLVGEDRAQTVALHDAGLEASQVENITVKLVHRHGGWFYKVGFNTYALRYSYTLEAYSGAVTQRDIDD